MNALNTIAPNPACVCGWNTPTHNADVYEPRKCPAVQAATKRLFDEGYSTTKMTRWSNYWIDPNDVAIVVLTALQAAHADALAEQAEAFEAEELPDNVIPIRSWSAVPTSSTPLRLDHYAPPFIGRAA